MIKEFFEIENKQKNTFLIFLGLTIISFLQLFIFKRDIFEGNFMIVIGLSLAMALCWTILNIFPLTIILSALVGEGKWIYENVIVGSGLLIIAGQILLTYIGYKSSFKFEIFIDFAWQKTLIVYGILFLITIVSNILSKEKK